MLDVMELHRARGENAFLMFLLQVDTESLLSLSCLWIGLFSTAYQERASLRALGELREKTYERGNKNVSIIINSFPGHMFH